MSWAPWAPTWNFLMQELQIFYEEKPDFRKVWPWSFWEERNLSCVHASRKFKVGQRRDHDSTQWLGGVLCFWLLQMGGPTLRSSRADWRIRCFSQVVSFFAWNPRVPRLHALLGLVMSVWTESPLPDLTPSRQPLTTSSVSTVVKIEMEALDFSEHSTPVRLNRRWCQYMFTLPLV